MATGRPRNFLHQGVDSLRPLIDIKALTICRIRAATRVLSGRCARVGKLDAVKLLIGPFGNNGQVDKPFGIQLNHLFPFLSSQPLILKVTRFTLVVDTL